MKNPIILKDLLIGVNNVIGKVTIVSILFLIASITILSNNFGVDISTSGLPSYFSNDDFLSVGYILIGGGAFVLSVIKGIISICFERSQMTYELIKISKISETKYILGKFLANLLYFALILIMLLPFAGMNAFLGGVSGGDILLLLVHVLMMGAIGGALGLVIGLIGRNITLSLLIAVGGVIFLLITMGSFYWFINIIESFLLHEDKKWYYSLLTGGLATLGLLIYAIQKVKNETEKNTSRYPLILSILLFGIAVTQVVFLEINAYYLLFFIGIIDLILLFININIFNHSEQKKLQYHILLNFIFIFSGVWFFEFLSWYLLGYILLVQLLIILISINVVELYKKINIYLQKFLYVIIVIFILYIVPHFVTNVKYYNPLNEINIYIPSVEKTYTYLYSYENNKYLSNIHTIPLLENKNTRTINTYYYLYLLLIILLSVYYGLYFFKRKK